MQNVIPDWNGRQVKVARSLGGVLALEDFSDNLIHGDNRLWPSPSVAQKLYQSRQVNSFDPSVQTVITRRLGYYCDLQSLHSEDAITWSVFGTMACSPEDHQVRFSNWLLEQTELPWRNRGCVMELWRRIPHPDTLVSGGPEIDVIVQGDQGVVLVEAKWRSSVAGRQGKLKDKDQIQLRCEFLAKYGSRVYGTSNFLVLGVGLEPVPLKDGASSVRVRWLTWEKICGYSGHPNGSEIGRYFQWKLEHTKR